MPTSSSSSGGDGFPCNFVQGVTNGFACFGTVQVGSNGAANGQPEVLCGGANTAGSDVQTGRITWCDDLSNGFDSGWVSVCLTASAGGGNGAVTFAVAGANPDPVVYSNATYGKISAVQVSSAVNAAGMKISWKQIVAKFYYQGNLVDTEPLPDPCQPVADTTSGGTSANQVVVINPAAQADSVVVTGLVRLQSNGNTLPNPQDIVGQIFAYG